VRPCRGVTLLLGLEVMAAVFMMDVLYFWPSLSDNLLMMLLSLPRSVFRSNPLDSHTVPLFLAESFDLIKWHASLRNTSSAIVSETFFVEILD
jgi:hypothetical protein